MSQLNPYLHFKNETRDAMEFYKGVFGGEVTLMSFKDAGVPGDPSEENNVMHSELRAGDLVFMASDTPEHVGFNPGSTVTMSLSGDNEAELRGYFDKLSDGATVDVPLDKAPWGDIFGMLTDKFGIEWMVNVNAQRPA
jgi:PhnB protein